MKKILSLIFLLICSYSCIKQNNTELNAEVQDHEAYVLRPKLVVGIVIDQMRYDYLTRFYSKYGDGGFKRLVKEGFNCKNNHYNYVPTYTGPGHTSIYTGTTPKYHGIISNEWYDKEIKNTVYCAGDSTVQSVGTLSAAGQMSPHRMLTTTFADENRLFTQMRGKTVGISIKDRGAILPAGHTANAAYWFYGEQEGLWITSTFYTNELPDWVDEFNNSNKVESYFKVWNTLYDIKTYTESGSDLNNFEGIYNGKETATFPYDLMTLKDKNRNFEILKVTPYGNSITTDFAIAALDGEELGQDNTTDVFTVSFSSTDYVGHYFGVNSKEIEDTYIRMDKDLERLLNALDSKVGEGEYTVFLTADHGAVNVPSYLQSLKIPSGYINSVTSRQQLNDFMFKTFKSKNLIENVSNNQVFLNKEAITQLRLNVKEVQEAIANELINHEFVDKVYTASAMSSTSFNHGVELLLQNGFNQKRSGDVLVVYDPAVISYSKTGSTHGSALNYDTHVPLIFFGKGINHGSTVQKTYITDIAPTISSLLGISFPNGATGKPLEKVLRYN
jgi:predicted AlkP superfamily pyrophosphatase or phosphodiesterase